MKQNRSNEQPREEKAKTNGLENKPFSNAVQQQKEMLYSRLPVTRKQVDIVLWLAVAALIVVVILIGLEAAGIFKIG